MKENTLHGGSCDGMSLENYSFGDDKYEDITTMYAGRMGDGKVHVYERAKEDGLFHFSHTITVDEYFSKLHKTPQEKE